MTFQSTNLKFVNISVQSQNFYKLTPNIYNSLIPIFLGSSLLLGILHVISKLELNTYGS